ncbi:MAG: Gfo/Idh/MocA family oxidoreductase [Chloroflexi bacterium]|nr:Gfo/Idh/MocA family oxidoreductase [Chloroflexota bacterium]
MEKLKLLVVGLGSIVEWWLDAVQAAPYCELTGIVDLDPSRLKVIGDQYGVPEERRFKSVTDALKKGDINAVQVMVPPPVHYPVVMEAFAAGLPVLSEKPLANTMLEAKELVAEAERRNLTFMVSQNYRYRPMIQAMKRAIDEQLIGRIGFISWEHHYCLQIGSWREELPNVVFEDMAIHHFDLMRYLTGANCVEIYAQSFNPSWSWYAGGACGNAMLRFEGDIYVTYHSGWVSRGWETSWDGVCTVEGEKGAIRLENDGFPVAYLGNDRRRYPLPMPDPVPPRGQEVRTSLAEFYAALTEGREAETSGKDNINSFVITQAAIQSSRTGEAVRIADLL